MGKKLKEGQPSLTLVAHKGIDSKQKLSNFDKLLASILGVMSSKNWLAGLTHLMHLKQSIIRDNMDHTSI